MKPALSVLLSALLCTACAAPDRPSENSTIEVYRSDESRQCEGGGIGLQQMRPCCAASPFTPNAKTA